MNSHTLFYYPYASFTNEQLPLLKVAALYFDKLIILDPVGASWATVGADHVAREVARDSGQFREQAGANPSEYYEYAGSGQAFDEYRAGYGGNVEYRYADFPLALGEAIMMNHALFMGLLHSGATPITDDPFHS